MRDDSPGITAEDRPHLFKKFARLSPRPTAGELSTGLGLTIVQRLTELMGGSVDCQSQPDAGSTFIVRLPPGESRRITRQRPLVLVSEEAAVVG